MIAEIVSNGLLSLPSTLAAVGQLMKSIKYWPYTYVGERL